MCVCTCMCVRECVWVCVWVSQHTSGSQKTLQGLLLSLYCIRPEEWKSISQHPYLLNHLKEPRKGFLKLSPQITKFIKKKKILLIPN